MVNLMIVLAISSSLGVYVGMYGLSYHFITPEGRREREGSRRHMDERKECTAEGEKEGS